MNTVLILGAGFGGLTAAHALRKRLPAEDRIILVDRADRFRMGFRKSWVVVGKEIPAKAQRRLGSLTGRGVEFVQGEIESIDPEARAVVVDGGRYAGEAMIVALGADLAPEGVAGFSEHALNFYSSAELEASASALRSFRGGRVVVGIFGEPYKCPPAPFELAFLLTDYLSERNIEAQVEVFSPKPSSLPVLGDAGCAALEGRLGEAGIRFLPHHVAVRVEPGRVIFKTGTRPFDLLFGVPAHRPPRVVAASGLTGEGGWVRVDPRTMETRFPGVYAVGDNVALTLADGKPHPKAGVFAEAQAQVAAERIADRLAGREPKATYPGEGYCFLEMGKGQAMLVRGNFMAEPAPQVELTEPSAEHLAAKERFEAERLERWFGAG